LQYPTTGILNFAGMLVGHQKESVRMPQLNQHSVMLALLLTTLLTGCPAMGQPTAAEIKGKRSSLLKSPQIDVPEAVRAYTQRVSSLKLRGYHNAY